MASHRRHSLPANDGVKGRRHESSMLAEENQDLEKKLRQLREAMQKEMQKRDEVRRALTAGAIWSSARPGPLQQITKDMSGPLPQTNIPRKSDRGSWSEHTAYGFKGSRMPDFRVGIGPRRPPAKLPPLSPKRTSDYKTQPEERPWSSKSNAKAEASRNPEDRSRLGSSSQKEDGPAGSLLAGSFDEERNRASFLEAVRAWRTGADGEAGTSDGQTADGGSPQSTTWRRPQSARPSTPAVCMEVQTELPAARPATARPRTARPRTYFEKLAERQAGHLASLAVQRSRQETEAAQLKNVEHDPTAGL